jgi:hypothetical protein
MMMMDMETKEMKMNKMMKMMMKKLYKNPKKVNLKEKIIMENHKKNQNVKINEFILIDLYGIYLLSFSFIFYILSIE